MTTENWLVAGMDFDHCDKGYCRFCSPEQRTQCEIEINGYTPKREEVDKDEKLSNER